MARKKKHEEHVNMERWLVSYADFITLLFAFFTAMYAISTVDLKKFKDMTQSVRIALGSGDGAAGGGVSIPQGGDADVPTGGAGDEYGAERQEKKSGIPGFQGDADLPLLAEQMENLLKNEELKQYVNIHLEPRGLVLSLDNTAFFDVGAAGIRPEAVMLVAKIGEEMKHYTNHIRVEGHSDNAPIGRGRFKNNWELSASRAAFMVELFTKNHNIPPKRLSIAGYAEHQPIASNDTPDGRRKNRRIEIVVLDEPVHDSSLLEEKAEVLDPDPTKSGFPETESPMMADAGLSMPKAMDVPSMLSPTATNGGDAGHSTAHDSTPTGPADAGFPEARGAHHGGAPSMDAPGPMAHGGPSLDDGMPAPRSHSSAPSVLGSGEMHGPMPAGAAPASNHDDDMFVPDAPRAPAHDNPGAHSDAPEHAEVDHGSSDGEAYDPNEAAQSDAAPHAGAAQTSAPSRASRPGNSSGKRSGKGRRAASGKARGGKTNAGTQRNFGNAPFTADDFAPKEVTGTNVAEGVAENISPGWTKKTAEEKAQAVEAAARARGEARGEKAPTETKSASSE